MPVILTRLATIILSVFQTPPAALFCCLVLQRLLAQVLCEEKLPMSDGSYSRIVVVPTLRILNSTITVTKDSTSYFEFYLPILENGTNILQVSISDIYRRRIRKITNPALIKLRLTLASQSKVLGLILRFLILTVLP